MLVVRVELHSALTGRVSEIGRMYIANDGTGGMTDGNYNVAVCRKGNDKVPRELHPSLHKNPKAARKGRVENYPRLAYNVWRLVTRALKSAFPEEAK